jgi:hypothetical protein
MRVLDAGGAAVRVRPLRRPRQRDDSIETAFTHRCFEACCCDCASSVMSDAAEKVPTGGELTLFEAVDRLVV